jgi:hypothetical protein
MRWARPRLPLARRNKNGNSRALQTRGQYQLFTGLASPSQDHARPFRAGSAGPDDRPPMTGLQPTWHRPVASPGAGAESKFSTLLVRTNLLRSRTVGI